MKKWLLILGLMSPFWAVSQSVGINNPNPDPSAILDVLSTTKGVLLPRMTTVQRNAISQPALGLMIYNTDTECISIYRQSGWHDICGGGGCPNPPNGAFTFSPNSPGVNSPVNFSAQPGLTYQWTFPSGSPNSSNVQSPAVTWANAGTYTITLTVTDNLGCTATTTQSITVTNCPPQPQGQTITFNFTGAPQQFVVPNCVSYIDVDAYGAQGFASGVTNHGRGGRVEARLTVNPGDVLGIYVGGVGAVTNGGWNGGGNAGANATYGAGGGASDIRFGGNALTDRILVAGGGGGTGSNCGTNSAPGGGGGGLTGQSGCTYSCSDCQYTGSGGTQSSGGIAGPTGHGSCGGNNNGVLGIGGSNAGSFGTGGGGGYYGGGSGCFEGAGGGSSYVTVVGSSNITHTQNVRNGSGMITISY